MRNLDTAESPSLAPAIRGRMEQTLHCRRANCFGVMPSEGEDFTTLTLPLQLLDGSVCTDVQSALDAYMPDEPAESEFRWTCPKCQATAPSPMKRQRPSSLPQVLMIQLNRWNSIGDVGALLHPVEANETIRFHADAYVLDSVFVHLGDNVNSGHYVAIARHGTNHGTWWLYDDARRVIATPDQISTTALYRSGRGYEQMKSYVLFYSRQNT